MSVASIFEILTLCTLPALAGVPQSSDGFTPQSVDPIDLICLAHRDGILPVLLATPRGICWGTSGLA
jgi:hypothetical protein